MSILIGIRNEHAHGSYHGAEGFEGFSMDANSIHILKSGEQGALKKYVRDARKEAKEAQKVMDEMQDEYGQYTNLTSDQWDRLYDQMSEKAKILQYSQLLIVEGILI